MDDSTRRYYENLNDSTPEWKYAPTWEEPCPQCQSMIPADMPCPNCDYSDRWQSVPYGQQGLPTVREAPREPVELPDAPAELRKAPPRQYPTNPQHEYGSNWWNEEGLITSSELAQLLGISRPAITNWITRHGDFPQPIKKVYNTRLYAVDEIKHWLEAHKRSWPETARVAHNGNTVGLLSLVRFLVATTKPKTGWYGGGPSYGSKLQEILNDAEESLKGHIEDGGDPDDVIYEIADSSVPVYHSSLLELAIENIWLATDEPELGPAFDGSATAVNIIAAMVYQTITEYLGGRVEAIREQMEEERELQEAEEYKDELAQRGQLFDEEDDLPDYTSAWAHSACPDIGEIIGEFVAPPPSSDVAPEPEPAYASKEAAEAPAFPYVGSVWLWQSGIEDYTIKIRQLVGPPGHPEHIYYVFENGEENSMETEAWRREYAAGRMMMISGEDANRLTFAEPVIGWRGWSMEGDLLTSLVSNAVWEPGQRMTTHVPFEQWKQSNGWTHGVGVHASNTRAEMESQNVSLDSHPVVGEIYLFGRGVRGKKGFKAEFGQIRALYVRDASLVARLAPYGVPVIVERVPGSYDFADGWILQPVGNSYNNVRDVQLVDDMGALRATAILTADRVTNVNVTLGDSGEALAHIHSWIEVNNYHWDFEELPDGWTVHRDQTDTVISFRDPDYFERATATLNRNTITNVEIKSGEPSEALAHIAEWAKATNTTWHYQELADGWSIHPTSVGHNRSRLDFRDPDYVSRAGIDYEGDDPINVEQIDTDDSPEAIQHVHDWVDSFKWGDIRWSDNNARDHVLDGAYDTEVNWERQDLRDVPDLESVENLADDLRGNPKEFTEYTTDEYTQKFEDIEDVDQYGLPLKQQIIIEYPPVKINLSGDDWTQLFVQFLSRVYQQPDEFDQSDLVSVVSDFWTVLAVCLTDDEVHSGMQGTLAEFFPQAFTTLVQWAQSFDRELGIGAINPEQQTVVDPDAYRVGLRVAFPPARFTLEYLQNMYDQMHFTQTAPDWEGEVSQSPQDRHHMWKSDPETPRWAPERSVDVPQITFPGALSSWKLSNVDPQLFDVVYRAMVAALMEEELDEPDYESVTSRVVDAVMDAFAPGDPRRTPEAIKSAISMASATIEAAWPDSPMATRWYENEWIPYDDFDSTFEQIPDVTMNEHRWSSTWRVPQLWKEGEVTVNDVRKLQEWATDQLAVGVKSGWNEKEMYDALMHEMTDAGYPKEWAYAILLEAHRQLTRPEQTGPYDMEEWDAPELPGFTDPIRWYLPRHPQNYVRWSRRAHLREGRLTFSEWEC